MALLPNSRNRRVRYRRFGPFGIGPGGSVNPTPLQPGAMQVVKRFPNSFTNFDQSFDLASDAAVVGLLCRFTGNPVVTITHGGEPLTVVQTVPESGVVSIMATGRGLTVESAVLSVRATGGTLDGGVLQIKEMISIAPALTGWMDNAHAAAPPVTPILTADTMAGTIKGIMYSGGVDTGHTVSVTNTESVWRGYIVAGPSVPEDTSTSGAWVLGEGWSIDGEDFVHTGPTSSSITLAHTTATKTASTQAYVQVGNTAGSRVDIKVAGGSISAGLCRSGYLTTAVDRQSEAVITATGDVRVSQVYVITEGRIIAWDFFSRPAEDDITLQGSVSFRPAWSINAVEILGLDYTAGTPSDLFRDGQAGYWAGGYSPAPFDPSQLFPVGGAGYWAGGYRPEKFTPSLLFGTNTAGYWSGGYEVQ